MNLTLQLTLEERKTFYCMLLAEIDNPLIVFTEPTLCLSPEERGWIPFGFCKLVQLFVEQEYQHDAGESYINEFLPELLQLRDESIMMGGYWFPKGDWKIRRKALYNLIYSLEN